MDKKGGKILCQMQYRIISDLDGIQRIKVLFETQRDGTSEIKQYPDIK